MKNRFRFYRFVPSDVIQDDGTKGEWVETTEDNGTHVIDLSKKGQAVTGAKAWGKMTKKMKKYVAKEFTKMKNGS